MKNIRGMSMQLLRLLMLAGIFSVSIFVFIHVCSDWLIQQNFYGSDVQKWMSEKRIENFRDYVSKHTISSTDTGELMSWCNKHPMVLMEIYRNNILCFNSNYTYTYPLIEQNIEMFRYDWYSYYELQFADGPAEVLIYSDESYILNKWITIAAIVFSGTLFIIFVLCGIRKTIRYIYLLCDEIQIMGGGDLEHPVTVSGSNELGMLARELDQMRSALLYHRKNEQDMIKQNNDMIICLSHDLRTPLTKLLLYTEIIQNKKYKDEQQLLQYLARIRRKCFQMKEISDHLFQYSLVQGELKTLETQSISLQNAFFERFSELTDYLSAHGFIVDCRIDWDETLINVNELLLDRILDNLISNIEKYAEKTYPVIIRPIEEKHFIGFIVKNMRTLSCEQTESSGVGIESIRTMMQQMNGICVIDQTNTMFELSILFTKG